MNRAFSSSRVPGLLTPLTLALFAIVISFSSTVAANQNTRIEQYQQTSERVVPNAYAGNQSIIHQAGNNNRVDVMQSYSAGYQAGNYAHIQQNGNFNAAAINQAGGGNVGVILQDGDRHAATINQSYGQQGLEAFVSQSGHQSDVHISQSGSGYSSISVEQQAFSGNARPVTIETY